MPSTLEPPHGDHPTPEASQLGHNGPRRSMGGQRGTPGAPRTEGRRHGGTNEDGAPAGRDLPAAVADVPGGPRGPGGRSGRRRPPPPGPGGRGGGAGGPPGG